MRKVNIFIMILASFAGGAVLAFWGCLSMTPLVHGQVQFIGDIVDEKPTSGFTPLHQYPLSDAEITFGNTLRSCLGSSCYDKPMGSAGNIVRIGVLTLPGTGSDIFLKLQKSISDPPANHFIVQDTHVPAYGYGKNHGWTRIIRFARNILDHAYFLVSENSNSGIADISTIYAAQVIAWEEVLCNYL